MWTPLGDLHLSTKSKLKCRCRCGKEHEVRVRELIDGKSRSCRSCSIMLRMARLPPEQRIALATKASRAAAKLLPLRIDKYKEKYGHALKTILNTAAAAKQRCTNPNSTAYSNYGGRGIAFEFPSVRAFAEWVLDNIGPKPGAEYSLDRIDNSRGYTPGNLRWATTSEQARNKRAYRRTQNGERIRRLKEARPDLTYETLRLWIAQGASDEEILGRKKYARAGL